MCFMKNISQIAAEHGTRLDNWMRLKSTQALIDKVEKENGTPSVVVAVGRNLPHDVKQLLWGLGVKDPSQGTYASDEIADAFEAWCQKDSQSKPSQVYFIRGDKTNSFKVGISSDPRARLKAMQVGSPVKLLLTRAVEVQNPESVEKELHLAFAKYRIHGEWFSMPWKEAVDIFDSIVQHS